MKVTINDYRAVALWRWNLRDASKGAEEEEEEDLDEEVCGICRVPFDGCCPDCKVPGDDCPLSKLFSLLDVSFGCLQVEVR